MFNSHQPDLHWLPGFSPNQNPLIDSSRSSLNLHSSINSNHHITALSSDYSLNGFTTERSPTDGVTDRKQSIQTSIQTRKLTRHRFTPDLDSLTGAVQGVMTQPDVTAKTVYTRYGELDSRDTFNPTRVGRYKDDYWLNVQSSNVRLNLNSDNFDAYLQVIHPVTGRVLAEDDDSGPGVNAQLHFNLQAGANYIVRVTSFGWHERGNYTLMADTAPTLPTEPNRFSNLYGYGNVNAAAAVSRAIGQAQFADLPGLDSLNWGNDLIQVPEVWASGFTGQNVTVAVVDTGVDYTHADLSANIWSNSDEIAGNGIDDDRNGYIDDIRGWNFIRDNGNPIDDRGHGTHVAGTIAAGNNGFGSTGVAYNAKIMPVKVLDRQGTGNSAAVAAGIRYAADNGANIINLSLGGDYPSTRLQRAVQYAEAQGALVVMAAGNSGRYAPDYPARYATHAGISVGAIDRNQSLASFSNQAGFDSRLQHVVAPGIDIYSTLPGNRYASYSGTSMATPHVAGVAALMLSANPTLTTTQAKQILTETAVNRSTRSMSSGGFNSITPLKQMSQMLDQVNDSNSCANMNASGSAELAVVRT